MRGNAGSDDGTYLTSPSSASLARVSCVSGVDARSHMRPLASLIAVERPPTAIRPRLNGLHVFDGNEDIYDRNVRTVDSDGNRIDHAP